MALNQQTKNPVLLDTLLELNDLVQALVSGEIAVTIKDLKNQTEEHKKQAASADASRSANEESIANLDKAAKEHDLAAGQARKQREALAAEKQENEKTLQKLQSSQSQLDASKREIEARAEDVEKIQQAKALSISERERKAEDRLKTADAIRVEYEKKLADLKKITG